MLSHMFGLFNYSLQIFPYLIFRALTNRETFLFIFITFNLFSTKNAIYHHFADLDGKNIQSGRGPRSDSDSLRWDNEANTFDDDYEGKLHVHC